MRVKKTAFKLLSLVGTVVSAGALAGVPVVHAADGDNDVAVFVGQTTGLTPVQAVGGTGTYQFSSIACAGVSTDTVGDVGTCSITSNGSYSNIVCGTGGANGSATVTENTDGGTDTFSYGITFASGVGVITGGATGVVVIVPSGTGAPASCVTSFAPVGAAVAN